jgi:hypothetical protein
MRGRAVGYADGLDSPLFSEAEREVYKARLRARGFCLANFGDFPCPGRVQSAGKIDTKDEDKIQGQREESAPQDEEAWAR